MAGSVSSAGRRRTARFSDSTRPRFPGAPDKAVHFETETGKPLLVIPWRGILLIGSTDVLGDGARQPRVSHEERTLLLQQVHRMFPEARLAARDILFEYAGIRPLPHAPGKSAGAITRRHHLHPHPEFDDRLVSVVGGKLTTHRALAEEAVDLVLVKLGLPPVTCTTRTLRLPGWIDEAARGRLLYELSCLDLSEKTAAAIVGRYGRVTEGIVARIRERPSLARPLAGEDFVAAEVVHAVDVEFAQSLTDVIYRRIVCRFDRVNEELVNAVSEVLMDSCGWTRERVAADRADLAKFADRVGTSPLTAP